MNAMGNKSECLHSHESLFHVRAVVFSLLFLSATLIWGCDSTDETVNWQSPRLSNPSSLVLRFSGKTEGKCLVSLAIKDSSDHYLISLAEATSLPGGRWSYVLPLKRPIMSMCTVHLKELGHSNQVSYSIDGERLVEETLSPVDRLSGKDLKLFLNRVVTIRRTFTKDIERDLFKATQVARQSMAEALSEQGINTKKLSLLRQLIVNLDKCDCMPGSDIAQRLIPLRFADALLSEKGYIRSPWGHVDKHLGFRFYHRLNVPIAGFQKVADHSFVNYVLHKELPGLKIEQWCWLATEKLLKQVNKSDKTVSFLYGNVIGATTSDVPPTSEYKGHVDFTLEVPTVSWPPKAAAMTLAVKVFARECLLRLNVNDKHSVAIVNSSFFFINKPDFRPYDFTGISFPIPVKALQNGTNHFTLELETVPFHEPPLPMRVHSAGLYFAGVDKNDGSVSRAGNSGYTTRAGSSGYTTRAGNSGYTTRAGNSGNTTSATRAGKGDALRAERKGRTAGGELK